MKRRLLATLVCCGTLALTGCSDDSSSTASSSTASSSTASSSPTHTEDQGKAVANFIDEWFVLLEKLNRTGDPAPLLKVSSGCDDCKAIAQNVAAIYSAGGWIHSDGYEVLEPLRFVRRTGKKSVVRFDLRAGKSSYKRSSSSPVESTESATGPIEVTVGLVNGHLRMLEFYRIAP